MSATSREHSYPGLFYDLLSGEFEPISDQLHRKHTLARLAYATVSKGAFVEMVGEGPGATSVFEYTPSWALNVVSRVLRIGDNVRTIGLRSGNSSLNIHAPQLTEDQDPHAVIIASLVDAQRLPMELGPELDSSRSYVANTAEIFFGNAYIQNGQQ